MKKKWLCGVLALVMLVSIFSGVTLPAQAVEALTASDDLIAVIKKTEGFTKYPTWDYLQYSIGYGCAVPEGKYEYYKTYGITEEEAVALLREHISVHEKAVNNYANKYQLTLTQHQFDALITFCLNCGNSWLYNPDGYLNTAIRTGASDSEIIYAFCLYSIAGNDYILQRRRLAEANMYLNGVYEAYNVDTDGSYPDTYRYVFLDGNGGQQNYAIHGYDGALRSEVITCFDSIPTGIDEEGNAFIYEFAGWYTAPTGGEKVEVLDASLPTGTVIYAQWKNPAGEIVQLPKGDVLEPLEVTVNNKTNYRTGPGTHYPLLGSISAGSVVTVTETYVYGGTTWGKFENGWFTLSYTNFKDALAEREAADESNWPKNGTVTGNFVNVRTGPGTTYETAGYQLASGTAVVICKTEYDGSEYTWGQLEDGNWVCMSYVQLEEEEQEPAPTLTGVTLYREPDPKEYVQMQDFVDLQGAVLKLEYSDGSIGALTPVHYMVDTYSNAELGETTVVLEYKGFTVSFTVNIVKATVTFLNEDGTVLSSAQYAYGETVTVPEVPAKPADENGEYTFAGWDKEVTTCHGDTTYTAVFELVVEEPDPTDPEETEPDETEPDGGDASEPTDPDDGDTTEPTDPDDSDTTEPTDPDDGDTTEPTDPDDNIGEDTTSEWPKTGVVTGDLVYLRSGPSTSCGPVGYLSHGDSVTIYDKQYEDTTTYWWGKVDEGKWICLSYVQFEEDTDPDEPTEPEDPTEPEYTPGDMDGSGIVDEDDAIYLLRSVFFQEDYPITIPADFDKSGVVDEDDAIYLLRHVFFQDDYPLT